MTVLRWAARLLLINTLFIAVIGLAGYFPGLDVLLALFYLAVIWRAGQLIGGSVRRWPYAAILLTGAIAQLPGLLLTAANISSYLFGRPIPQINTFIFQIWHTPWLPFLSFLAFDYRGLAAYFTALFLLSPLYIALLVLAHAYTALPFAGAIRAVLRGAKD